MAYRPQGTDLYLIEIGYIQPEGTVLGFSRNDDNSVCAIIFDESKEGETDSLSIVNCKRAVVKDVSYFEHREEWLRDTGGH